MGTILTLGAKLVADVQAYISDMGAAGRVTGGTNKSIVDMAKSALGLTSGIAAAGVALHTVTGFLKAAAAAAEESNLSFAKQEAILKATGYAAGLSGTQLQQMAQELSKLSGIDDEALADAQSLMLTFRNIGQTEFPRAMQAAVDLQTTFGGLESASMQLGKALNDPVAGLGALSRAGVTFSSSQKEQIAHFVKINDLASAQRIILGEVEKQVGGTAKAMNDASNGSANLAVSYENLLEVLGSGLTPATRDFNDALGHSITGLTKLSEYAFAYSTAVKEVARQRGLSNTEMARTMAYDQIHGGQVQNEIIAQMQLAKVTSRAVEEQKLSATQFVNGVPIARIATESIGEYNKRVADIQSGKITLDVEANTDQATANILTLMELVQQYKDMFMESVTGGADWLTPGHGTLPQDVSRMPNKTVVKPTAKNTYWIPNPAAPGHFMKNPEFGKAKGGKAGGLALVGEEGPEIVELPRGSYVHPNGEIPRFAAGGMISDTPYTPSPIKSAPFFQFQTPASVEVAKEEEHRSHRAEQKINELSDIVTANRLEVTRSNTALQSSISDLTAAIGKVQTLEIDYARLTRAIRDGSLQGGLR